MKKRTMRPLVPVLAAALTLVASATVTPTASALGETVLVATTTADDGSPGSLRARIGQAAGIAGPVIIDLVDGTYTIDRLCQHGDPDDNHGGDLDWGGGNELTIRSTAESGAVIEVQCAGERVFDHRGPGLVRFERVALAGGNTADGAAGTIGGSQREVRCARGRDSGGRSARARRFLRRGELDRRRWRRVLCWAGRRWNRGVRWSGRGRVLDEHRRPARQRRSGQHDRRGRRRRRCRARDRRRWWSRRVRRRRLRGRDRAPPVLGLVQRRRRRRSRRRCRGAGDPGSRWSRRVRRRPLRRQQSRFHPGRDVGQRGRRLAATAGRGPVRRAATVATRVTSGARSPGPAPSCR